MSTPKLFRVCRVLLGRESRFEPEPTTVFQARRGEELELVVAYEYREPSHEKDETRIRFEARLADQALPAIEERIEDHPIVSDSRFTYLSIPVRAQTPGRHEGRYVVETEYVQESWEDGKPIEQRRQRHEGVFVLDVR